MYALAVVASLLVTLSLASPSIVERQTSSGCATSDHTNFTLLAINSALEIQLYVGLATDQNSADFGWLASAYTVDSGPPFITSYLSMAGGGIIATTSDGVIVGTSNEAPMAQHGGVLTFALEPVNTNSPPDPGVYCVQNNTGPLGDEFPNLLSMSNGDSGYFSTCVRSDGADNSVIVYNASQAHSGLTGYNFVTCTNVTVAVIGAEAER